MSYSDDYTEIQIAALERKLKRLYNSAYKEIANEADSYFRNFQTRYDTMYAEYQNGKYTKNQFDNWVQAQVGRGERWAKLRDEMAERITYANQIAASYINDRLEDVFTTNYNFSAFEIEKGTGATFNIYNEAAVQRLMTEQPELLPWKAIDESKDIRWNRKRLTTALTSAIIQGQSIDKLADSFQSVADMNRNSAVRNARTALTGAQNAGRQKNMDDVYEKASAMGFKIQKEWISAHDGRVRDSHAHLDGVRVEIDEKFPNGLMYPADPSGAPAEVYNCRCAMGTVINGISATRTSNTKESYEKWLEEKANIQRARQLARSGAKITNPDDNYSREWAESYYKEIRRKSTDYKKIAARLNLDEKTVKKVKDYLFETGTWYNKDEGVFVHFSPDASIAQSWQRLSEGKKIFKHDELLVYHEIYEMQIKEDNPSISHDEAHRIANTKYNYQEASKEYYDSLRKSKKS